ncbi:hypothetical protein [Priestia megaterium]|uniref:hypothetical protein n=1 Tax=Priestia megaterium TaxID=1404 RepID=UPI002E20FB83|nr:hypothetical protein [Priestia megaterium]MED4268366.1 hypothetical protein [Priestia megaterium]MED4279273.1 hypothetical protein [Priestia megaterium]MED4314663.1 hypothetical protein [Priestia megaterium]
MRYYAVKAFAKKEKNDDYLRWFGLGEEIGSCGQVTLATGGQEKKCQTFNIL